MQTAYNQKVTQSSPSMVATTTRQPRKTGGRKRDLLPVMALLGAVYGWVLAVLALLIVAIILIIV